MLVDRGAYDPGYKSYPFGDTLPTIARDRGFDEIAAVLESALARGLAHKWIDSGEIDYEPDDEQLRFDRANPNAAGAPWSTPLAWARKNGHAEIERMLVAAGAA